MAKQKKKSSDATKIINRMIGKDKKLQKLVSEAKVNAQVAQLIYHQRKKAHLTQKQLADKLGTTQSVIARLEDADYDGHSLTMLQRVAEALNQHITISMQPEKRAA